MRYEEYVKIQTELLQKSGLIDKNKIPDLELYMDQVESFFASQLKDITDDTNKWHVTKTMISNYTKYSIIPRSDSKKYSRDHLLMLTMVLYLKGIFKIDDIETLMKPLVENYSSVFDDKINPELLYTVACNLNEKFIENFSNNVNNEVVAMKKLIEDTDIADDERSEVMILILSLAIKADMEKLLAMKLMETYFAGPEKEKRMKNKKTKDMKPASKKVKRSKDDEPEIEIEL